MCIQIHQQQHATLEQKIDKLWAQMHDMEGRMDALEGHFLRMHRADMLGRAASGLDLAAAIFVGMKRKTATLENIEQRSEAGSLSEEQETHWADLKQCYSRLGWSVDDIIWGLSRFGSGAMSTTHLSATELDAITQEQLLQWVPILFPEEEVHELQELIRLCARFAVPGKPMQLAPSIDSIVHGVLSGA